jgi:C-terminal processing protease CtpA/Prc
VSERSRYPLLIALVLGLLAAFLLWWRPRRVDASAEAVDPAEVAVTTRRAESGTVGAGFSEGAGWVAVTWLTPNGPAARAGLRVGDRLLAVDGLVVHGLHEAEQRTRGRPGTSVQLSIRRESGQEQQLHLTRAE